MKPNTTPIFEGTILAKARKIVDRRIRMSGNKGKVVIAIDADGMTYRFNSCVDVEKQTRIKASRISLVINRFKHNSIEVPICEGYCWMYEADMDMYEAPIKAWIALNALDTRKTTI